MKTDELKKWNQRVSKLLLETRERRLEQLKKWRVQSHDLPTWMTILGEEYGELCRETLDVKFGKKNMTDFIKLRNEALDVAAVALAIAQCAEHGEA